MLTADELRALCQAIRDRARRADPELVGRIEADVQAYRGFLTQPRPQLPPPPLDRLLPLLGWLIYEASWEAVQRVAAAFERLGEDGRAASEAACRLIARLADAARGLPWPEFAPRALGAIRADALAHSKRDTQAGYDAAWVLHQEARARHASYRDSHGDRPERDRYLLDLDEVVLQLALAETGTACRTAERVISRWAEEFAAADQDRWIQRMYRELSEAVQIGERAIVTVGRIADGPGLVEKVTEHRLAMRTGFQNPGIMTARAALLTLALCPAMEGLRRAAPPGLTWPEARAELLARFTTAYRAVEAPVSGADGAALPMHADHQRSLVQLRLHLALLRPGSDLPSTHPFDPCLAPNPLDGTAVLALAGWLATPVDGVRRGDANAIGSATMPGFLRSVVDCRSLPRSGTGVGAGAGYRQWRIDWFELDRYTHEPGRRERVLAALADLP